MASGTGERPLGTLAEERSLLGINTFRFTTEYIRMADAGETGIRYLYFGSGNYQQGLVVISGTSSVDKDGVFFYGATSATNLHLRTILAPGQSGLSVVATGVGKYITITNPQYDLLITVLSFWGGLPEITKTQR